MTLHADRQHGTAPEPIRQMQLADTRSYVYFMGHVDKAIRIGSSADCGSKRFTRIRRHLSEGFRTLLAVLPATEADEQDLHRYFEASRLRWGDSKSVYAEADVMPFVKRLLEFNIATNDKTVLCSVGSVPFTEWNPDVLMKRRYYGFVPPLGATYTGQRQVWQSPLEVFTLCRQLFGQPIVLDPASDLSSWTRIPEEDRPRYFYSAHNNGLLQEWFGHVFCNPPYGKDDHGTAGAVGADAFVHKMIEEVDRANSRVKAVVMLLNLQSIPTQWWPTLFRSSRFPPTFAIAKERIRFGGPAAKRYRDRGEDGPQAWGGSKNGSVFIYHGPEPAVFCRVFSDIAYPTLMSTGDGSEFFR